MITWIPNIGSTKTRDTKYYRRVYWHLKALLRRALTDKQAILNDLFMQIEYLQLQVKSLDKKIIIMASTLGLHFEDLSNDIPLVPKENAPPSVVNIP